MARITKKLQTPPDAKTEYELTVPFGNESFIAYLQNGFFKDTRNVPFMHKHNGAEIQLFLGGTAKIKVDRTVYEVKSGSGILIPQDTYHEQLSLPTGVIRVTFQTNLAVKETLIRELPSGIFDHLLNEIDYIERTKDFSRVSAYLSIITASFVPPMPFEAKPCNDYPYVIREFFTRSYHRDVHLYDLAELLSLSPTHAARLVEKHTGRGFSEELTRQRILVAEQHIKEGVMTLAEIAEKVGFHTYSGFWKAYKRYSSTRDNSQDLQEKDN